MSKANSYSLPECYGTRNATQRDLTARGLAIRAQSYNAAERSFEAVVATETRAEVFDFRTYEVIEEILLAEGGEFPDRCPLLDSHNRAQSRDVIGSATAFRREGRNWLGRGIFASDDAEVDRIAARVRDGHIRDVSIGYEVLAFVTIPARTTQEVNGRPYTAGDRTLRITTRWRVSELSVTPIGADQQAKIRNGLPSSTRSVIMNPRLLAYLRSVLGRPAATEEECRQLLSTLSGAQRAIANLLDYDAADSAARGAADVAIRALGYDPFEPTRALPAGSSRRQQRADAGTDDEDDEGNEDESMREESGEDADREDDASVESRAARRPRRRGRRALESARLAGAAAERDRHTQIRTMAGDLVPAALIERAIAEGWSIERASPVFLQAVRDSRGAPLSADVPTGGPAIHSQASRTGYSAEMLAAALMHRSGCDPTRINVRVDADGRIQRLTANADQRSQVAEQGWRYANLSMRELLRMCARLDGISVTDAMGVGETLRAINTRAGMSTNTFLNVFTTNIAAQLVTAYEQFPDSTTGGWVSEADVTNFLTQERARMEKGPSLQRLPRQKEADHAEFADNAETYKIARYARQFVIDEQDIVDDRFNGINPHVAQEFGQAAARLRPDLVYALLLANANMRDAAALFVAGHGNLNTSNALAIAGLTTARKKMMLQQENGVNLGLVLRFLLVPPSLEVTALELSQSPLLITGSDTVRPAMNALASSGLTVVPEPRLENGVTDPATGTTHAGSATTWFGAAATTAGPTIEVGYLAGTGRAPQLRSGMLDRGQWGMWFDVKHDIGAKALDWRGLQKNTA